VNAWVLDWLRAFLITAVLEVLVAVPFLALAEAHLGRRLAAVLLVNLATHPLVWFLFPGISARYPVRVALSEAWALAAETAGYWIIWPRLGLGRAFTTSLLANAASFIVGLLLPWR
jgi:hypothetical protein